MLKLEDPVLMVNGSLDSSRGYGLDARQHVLIIGAAGGSVKAARIRRSMQTPTDIAIARMNLAAAILTLLAALVGIAYAVVPQIIARVRGIEDKQRAVLSMLRNASIIFGIAAAVAMFAGTHRLGLLFLFINVVLLSIDYVLGDGPPPRGRTLLLVVSWVAISSLALGEVLLSLFEKMVGLH